MLATALSAYSGFNATLGSVTVDLTYICSDLTCTSHEDVSTQFGQSAGSGCLSISAMLTYAASQSTTGNGSIWYGNQKFPTQEFAKDAFDAINNAKAYAGAC
jgi:hypothetical protein